MNNLILNEIIGCKCGKSHRHSIKRIVTGSGAVNALPEIIGEIGASYAFVISDKNTEIAAGSRVKAILDSIGLKYTCCYFDEDHVMPDEKSVGYAAMYFDKNCDVIITAGSGVLNDIGKIISNISGKPYIIVGTAPSMDGYASDSSSMTRGGLKISLKSRAADYIIGDTDILKNAPLRMMKSGLGDMIAKYVSICEWRISNLISGEYFCPVIADLVRTSLKRCTDNAAGLLERDEEAVTAVFEGLVICGIAMNYAGISRPASGVEHYLSHIWDMRAIEFGTPEDFHGIQCAVGSLIAVRLYEKLRTVTFDRKKALAYASGFDFEKWSEELRNFLGKGAESMIALEAKEGKYDLTKHAERLEVILGNRDKILGIIEEELPTSAELEKLLDTIDAPKTMADINLDESILGMTVKASKDIRDKYVLPRLMWDLGILDEML
nr:sn-glycerol-1-phosphate dehydrogenase [Clostridia bacterium]